MSNVIVLHRGSANNQETNWIPTIPGNDGLSVQNNDGDYVASGNGFLGNPKNPFDWWNDITAIAGTTPLWIDDGTLSAPGVVINSVTLHIIHGNFDGANDLDVWYGFSTGGGGFFLDGYDQANFGTYSVLVHTFSGYVEWTRTLTTNPVTGVAWTANDLFLAAGLGGSQSFYFDKFRDGAAYPNYLNYRINQIYLDVSYTISSIPTSVSVIGAGGVEVSGPDGVGISTPPALAFGVSAAGIPPELHLNQWGLEGFSLQTDLEEHL